MLDVDGRLGGFNFQWAWSSAFVAAHGADRASARLPLMRRFKFWGFKSSNEILENSLGTLERDVMQSCGHTAKSASAMRARRLATAWPTRR